MITVATVGAFAKRLPLEATVKMSGIALTEAHNRIVRVTAPDGVVRCGEAALAPTVTGELPPYTFEAVRYLAPLAVGCGFGEQPVNEPDLAAMAACAAAKLVPIGANDVLHNLDDISRHHDAHAVSGGSLKPIMLVVIIRVMGVGWLMERLGMAVNMAETSVASTVIAYGAVALPRLDWGTGVTNLYLEDDVCGAPITIPNNTIAPLDGLGLGARPNTEKLSAHRLGIRMSDFDLPLHYFATFERKHYPKGYEDPISQMADCYDDILLSEAYALVRSHRRTTALDAYFALPDTRVVNNKKSGRRGPKLSGTAQRLTGTDRMTLELQVVPSATAPSYIIVEVGLCDGASVIINDYPTKAAALSWQGLYRLIVSCKVRRARLPRQNQSSTAKRYNAVLARYDRVLLGPADAAEFHVRRIFLQIGTGYSFDNGEFDHIMYMLTALGIDEDKAELIWGHNAVPLFGLDPEKRGVATVAILLPQP